MSVEHSFYLRLGEFFFFFYDAGDCKNKAKCGSEISLFRSGKRGVAMRITVIVCVCECV